MTNLRRGFDFNEKEEYYNFINNYWIILNNWYYIFFTYTGIYYHAEGTIDDYLKTTSEVEVIENNNYISFVNKNSNNKNAIIFYEEAKVEAKAYARILYILALNDISCYAIKITISFCFF
ncbi:MAG: hypothetical protein L6U99_08015 [Clostridium sp.]|nr:MAG: hypothetical protein L6U99_08015 [Clostridium sp.]